MSYKINPTTGKLDYYESAGDDASYLKLDQTTPQTITGGIPLLTGLTPTTDYQIATKKYVDDNVGAVPPPANGSVTYSDGKIIEIVNGSKTYNITYDSDYIKTITNGTTTWTFIYSDGVITGWTV